MQCRPLEKPGLIEQQTDDDERDEGRGGVPDNGPHQWNIVQCHDACQQGQDGSQGGAPTDAQALGLPDDQHHGEQENDKRSKHAESR
ncbi:hypothetical protein D3C81_349200 [compost metagenome]